jgi:hypothetical protein
MSDYLRVSLPADLPVMAVDLSKQSTRENITTVDAGDLIALANAGLNDETLWVVVLKKDENNGSSDICIAYPEKSLAVGSDVIVEKDVANNSFEFCIWPQVVSTVWTDDLVGGERHGKISDEALEHVRHLSMPGAKPTSGLVLPKGIRFGVDGIAPTLSYLKFRGTTAEVLDKFAKPWWSLWENTFVSSSFALAGLSGDSDKASIFMQSEFEEFQILPDDLEEVANSLRKSGLSVLMRGGKFNSLNRHLNLDLQFEQTLVLENTEEENIKRATEALGSFRLLTAMNTEESTTMFKHGSNRVLVEAL